MGALVDAFPNGCMSVNEICERLGKSYEEALADLRRLGHGINFDTSEIPAELYDAHKLAGFELMCTLLMMADSFRAAVCLHEAAHAEYTERLWVRAVENSLDHGSLCCQMIGLPRACLNAKGELTYATAGVYEGATNGRIAARTALDHAKMLLSPGIAGETMTGRWDGQGLESDEEQLESFFDEAGLSANERQRIRQQARDEILKDLRSPALRKSLWARAKFFQKIYERDLWATPDRRRVIA